MLICFSQALDHMDYRVSRHQQRTAYIALKIGRALTLPNENLNKLFIAALFHDIGAFTIEEKVALYEFDELDTTLHSKRGAMIFRQHQWLEPMAEIVEDHHKPWSDYERGSVETLQLEKQILYMADHIERSIHKDIYILFQNVTIRDNVEANEGGQFNHQLVDAFLQVSKNESFWLDIDNPEFVEVLDSISPLREVIIVGEEITPYMRFFEMLSDLRFLNNQVTEVSYCVKKTCDMLRLDESLIPMIVIASYLYDISKEAKINRWNHRIRGLSIEETIEIKEHIDYIHELFESSEYKKMTQQKGLIDTSIGIKVIVASEVFMSLLAESNRHIECTDKDVVEAMTHLMTLGEVEPYIGQIMLDAYQELDTYLFDKQKKLRRKYINLNV
jgi:response regulator RpfG family c-di-GMP phosphodiesterase